MRRPRILFLCDRRGWAFDKTAQNLKSYLTRDLHIDIAYVVDRPDIDTRNYDLIYAFWWGEKYHRRFLPERSQVVKEISSHRWEHEEAFLCKDASEAVSRFMHDASHLMVTSQRLYKRFSELGVPIYWYPLGIDESVYFPRVGSRDRTDRLVFGWAGNPNDPLKRFNEILLPSFDESAELRLARGDHTAEEMPEFYRSIDVIVVTSTAEGTPLPLIEAMACGAFPITTDVGVAPEVIKNGENGIIIGPSVDELREARNWCIRNRDYVRQIGAENSELIRRTRTWRHSAAYFKVAIMDIVKSTNILSDMETDQDPHVLSLAKSVSTGTAESDFAEGQGYEKHFDRINANPDDSGAFTAAVEYILEDLEPLLPKDRDAVILEIGTGHGHVIRYLIENGYRRVHGIDRSADLLREVQRKYGDKAERLQAVDAKAYFELTDEKYDLIILFDVIEHFSLADAGSLLRAAKPCLRSGGRIVLRTPNLANVLGGYSLYMDATHKFGFTEWTLIGLLESCDYGNVKLHTPSRFASRSRRLKARLNAFLHRTLYWLNDRAMPHWWGKNIVVVGERK